MTFRSLRSLLAGAITIAILHHVADGSKHSLSAQDSTAMPLGGSAPTPAWFQSSHQATLDPVVDPSSPISLDTDVTALPPMPSYREGTFQSHSPYYQAALSAGDQPLLESSVGITDPHPTPVMGFSPPPTLFEATWRTFDTPEQVYDSKKPVPTQQPWIEWGRGFYAPGMVDPGGTLFSEFNLLHPTFYLYGDYRLGVGSGRNAAGRFDNLAHRLNLEMDLALTATERFHGFIGPFNNANKFTQVRWDNDEFEFDPHLNANLVTGFFEGDLGYMLGGINDSPADFELPIAAGLMPLLYQNGIWMDDAASGVAISRNAQHSRLLNWSNYDASLFAMFDQINSPVFGPDNHAAQAFGTAWFIEAYGGYIEAGYAYVRDREELGRSYNNATLAFTRRYFDRIGNSVRVIVNSGQDLPANVRTADGGLLILENNWITANSVTFVPYMNMFYGWGSPQSVARNALAGGVLRNVGINFETDGLNGYPTLNDTGNNTVGGAVGVNLLGATLDRQLVLEGAWVHGIGSASLRSSADNEYGLGLRYQVPLSHCTLVRFDTMYGCRESAEDLYGARAEFRYKF